MCYTKAPAKLSLLTFIRKCLWLIALWRPGMNDMFTVSQMQKNRDARRNLSAWRSPLCYIKLSKRTWHSFSIWFFLTLQVIITHFQCSFVAFLNCLPISITYSDLKHTHILFVCDPCSKTPDSGQEGLDNEPMSLTRRVEMQKWAMLETGNHFDTNCHLR